MSRGRGPGHRQRVQHDRTQCTCYQYNTGLACTTNELCYVSNVEYTIRVLSGADGTIYDGHLSWSATWDYLYNRRNPIVARLRSTEPQLHRHRA